MADKNDENRPSWECRRDWNRSRNCSWNFGWNRDYTSKDEKAHGRCPREYCGRFCDWPIERKTGS